MQKSVAQHVVHIGEMNVNSIGWKIWWEDNHLEDPGIDGRTIFKERLNRQLECNLD